MARPIEFDRNEVVEKALGIFRKKGYNGTSMRDLEAITGLNPGSFYSAFGNKHEFFLETLRFFYQLVQKTYSELTSPHANPVDGLRAFFNYITQCVTSDDTNVRCCYVIKSALELAAVDEQVHTLVGEHFNELEKLITNSIQQAVDKSFLSPSTNVEVTAKLLLNNLYGLNVNGMINPQHDSIVLTVDKLFNTLLPTNH